MEYDWEKLQLRLEEDSRRRRLRSLERFHVVDEAAFCREDLFEELLLPRALQKDVAILIVNPPGPPDNWFVCEGHKEPDAEQSASDTVDRAASTDPELPPRK